MPTPYSQYVEGRDPVAVMAETIVKTRAAVSRFTPQDFERSHAPGKWSVREVLIHLAHGEIVFGTRVRFALTTPGYVVQPFDQDAWMALDRNGLDGNAALALFSFTRALNLGLFKQLTPEQRAATFRHPEQGEIKVEDVLVMSAGHEVHHLAQLEEVARGVK
ncbi:MAG: DinB family protein [Acidobacteriota bacterium]|nr:DinB family protein [Acidobacteriota bacterium]